MNVKFRRRLPWLSLALLCLAYTLLGWYLSAHHIFLLIGAFGVSLSLAFIWKNIPWLERLLTSGYQGLLAVASISILLSLLVTWSPLITLIVLPVLTAFWAGVEVQLAGFNKLDTLLLLVSIAVASLGLSEVIDIIFWQCSRSAFWCLNW
jgi:hypothetical protein